MAAAAAAPAAPPVPASAAVAYRFLALVHPPARAAEIVNTQIVNRPLPLFATGRDARKHKDAREQRRAARAAKANRPSRKPKPLSAKEKRALGVHTVDRAALKYETFAPLHDLWIGYARELVAQGGGAPAVAAKMCTADFHGADVEVVRSRDVGRVGIRGIVVKETRGAMLVVRSKEHGGGSKLVPKEHTVFRFEIPLETGKKMVFELNGNQFMWRAADRANRKFKPKPMWDL